MHRHPRFTLVRLVLPGWSDRARFYYDGRKYSCTMVGQGWSIEEVLGGTAVAAVTNEGSAWVVTSLRSRREHSDGILFLAVAAAIDDTCPELPLFEIGAV